MSRKKILPNPSPTGVIHEAAMRTKSSFLSNMLLGLATGAGTYITKKTSENFVEQDLRRGAMPFLPEYSPKVASYLLSSGLIWLTASSLKKGKAGAIIGGLSGVLLHEINQRIQQDPVLEIVIISNRVFIENREVSSQEFEQLLIDSRNKDGILNIIIDGDKIIPGSTDFAKEVFNLNRLRGNITIVSVLDRNREASVLRSALRVFENG